MSHLKLVPVILREANAFIRTHHRHHSNERGARFVVGVENGHLRGVAVLGRPKSRMIQELEPGTAEVTRCCTDGTKNACSMLYSACARGAAALGYRKIITYILAAENGLSLKASGWSCDGPAGGGSWDRADRHRTDKAPIVPKIRWSKQV